MTQDTSNTSKSSNPIPVRAFNPENGQWEYMLLLFRCDWVGGRGHVFTYQRVGTPLGISPEGFEKGRRLGLIKLLDEHSAKVLWLNRSAAA